MKHDYYYNNISLYFCLTQGSFRLVVGIPPQRTTELFTIKKPSYKTVSKQPLFPNDTFTLTANRKSGLALFSDYSIVKALMFQTKKVSDFSELKGFQLTLQDLEKNPLILRNIKLGLAERLMAESKKVDSLKTMPLHERRELSDALRYIASDSWKDAQSLSLNKKAAALRFGRDWRYNGKTRQQRFNKALEIIGKYSAGATFAGGVLSLIPFAGPIGLTLVTQSMLRDFGKEVYGKDFKWSLTGIASTLGAAAGPALATEMASWATAGPAAPLVNCIANGGSAGALHVGFGTAYFLLFESQINRGQQVHMPEALEAIGTIASAFFAGQAEFRDFAQQQGQGGQHFWDRLDALVEDMERRLPANM